MVISSVLESTEIAAPLVEFTAKSTKLCSSLLIVTVASEPAKTVFVNTSNTLSPAACSTSRVLLAPIMVVSVLT